MQKLKKRVEELEEAVKRIDELENKIKELEKWHWSPLIKKLSPCIKDSPLVAPIESPQGFYPPPPSKYKSLIILLNKKS